MARGGKCEAVRLYCQRVGYAGGALRSSSVDSTALTTPFHPRAPRASRCTGPAENRFVFRARMLIRLSGTLRNRAAKRKGEMYRSRKNIRRKRENAETKQDQQQRELNAEKSEARSPGCIRGIA